MKSKVLNVVDKNRLFVRYFYVIISLFISACYFNLLVRPINLVSGGTGGISIIFEELFGIDPSLTIFLLSCVLLFLCYLFLSKEDTFAALLMAVVYPFFVSITSGIGNIIVVDTSNTLLIVIYAAVLCGFTNGLIYVTGLNIGGLGIIGKIIAQKFVLSEVMCVSVICFIVVLCGSFVFGVNMLLYAAIYLYISKYISDKMLLGISRNKMVYIVSFKHKEIVSFIKEELGHDATIYSVNNGMKDRSDKMIMSMIPSSEYYVLKEGVSEIDKKAFVFVCDSYEVKGQDIKLKSVK